MLKLPISKGKTAIYENSFANAFFGFPNRTVKRNLDLDFLIEIHPEDGFLGGETVFRPSESRSIAKFKFGFPN